MNEARTASSWIFEGPDSKVENGEKGKLLLPEPRRECEQAWERVVKGLFNKRQFILRVMNKTNGLYGCTNIFNRKREPLILGDFGFVG
jgi:hypothetical protein